ncbi:MAG: NADH-quinone oxidoreductase subunit NuoF [Candidatus Acetothermia bacterium]
MATTANKTFKNHQQKQKNMTVLVCGGAGCRSSGSDHIEANLRESLKDQELVEEVEIIETGCMGPCSLGPLMVVHPEGVFYKEVQPSDVEEVVEEHLLKGRKVERLLLEDPEVEQRIEQAVELQFFHKQHKVALENCGQIDPENIEEYIARDGYLALGTALQEMEPREVIQVIKDSGLRGRGGAGFPTGLKWEFTAAADSVTKYVLCNADEGDPGAFMDRSVLEGDPHRVLEAMAIAGYAIGANQGYIYVRAEYPKAVERLQKAIEQAREYELLGEEIFNSDFDFDIELRMGAGSFVCGEETALMRSIEGQRGMPTPRPPYPANKGLWEQPTLLNNVETYANVPNIIRNGPEWFSSMGTEDSPGTKVFALAGDVKNTGLVEVPMGITLEELVYEVGGGVPEDKEFKAAQTGGPSGGCITEDNLDMPIDYESLQEAGSIMGSGGLIVMDESTCMVDVAKFFMDFIVDESCGQCTPCRDGTKQMYDILERITQGQGEPEDVERLRDLADTIKKTSFCGLGQTAPNPVLSTLDNFEEEYRAHIEDQRCPAGVCLDLIKYEIDPEACRGCSKCAQNCPVDAINGEPGEIYEIDQETCIKCGNCFEVCPFDAVEQN